MDARMALYAGFDTILKLHKTVVYNLYIHLYGDGFDEMYTALVGNVQ